MGGNKLIDRLAQLSDACKGGAPCKQIVDEYYSIHAMSGVFISGLKGRVWSRRSIKFMPHKGGFYGWSEQSDSRR
jgi:hypothetical protein